MDLRLYNTLSRKKEVFKPIKKGMVGMYTCGPTVYGSSHIGNYRAYVFADILKRTLSYLGYKVKQVMNLTDVDDKTIRDSQKAGKSLRDFTEHFTQEFYRDRDLLNIIPADTYTKATDYINEMVSIIETLLIKGYAYKSVDGSIYFSIKKDKEYGKLSRLDLGALKEGASGRMLADEYEKNDAQDFVLWKSWDKTDGDVYWETRLGKGRPGWHIECSAMSMENLGQSFDVHTGGVDNIFPHHENEIAQSECATGKTFVKYWMHNGWLLIDEKKMAKSLGNFYTLEDLSERGIPPVVFRYFLLSAHYRSKLNFTWEAVEAAGTAYERMVAEITELPSRGRINKNYKNKFSKFISDDLGTPRALAVIWEILKDTELKPADKKATILDFDKVLGLGIVKSSKKEIPEDVLRLAEERENYRRNKEWEKSDELRNKILGLGYVIEDAVSGYKLKNKKRARLTEPF